MTGTASYRMNIFTDLRENYTDEFVNFLKKVAKKSDSNSDSDWVDGFLKNDAGERYYVQGRYTWHDTIEIEEYHEVKFRKQYSPNCTPDVIIELDAMKRGKTESGVKWCWGPTSGLLVEGKNAIGELEYHSPEGEECKEDEVIGVYSLKDFLKEVKAI